MGLIVSRGIEDALAPDPRPSPPPPSSEPDICGASRLAGREGRHYMVVCQKRPNHDDPLSEIGGVQTDPNHRASEEADGVTTTYEWRTR
jgi:hypothetical protein